MPDTRLSSFKTPWQMVNGLALYRVCHSSTPKARVLFSHGNGLTAATYQGLVNELAKDFDVIAFDSRNHGASAPFETLDTVENTEAFADDQFMLANWLENEADLSPLPLHLVVHSINAIAASRGMNRPQKPFVSIALLDPVYLKTRTSIALTFAKPLGLAIRYHPLARGAQRRRSNWPDYQAAEDYLIGRKALSNWPTSAVEAYIYSAISPDDAGGVSLNCVPAREARFFTTIPTRYIYRPNHPQSPCLVIRGETGEVEPQRLGQIASLHGQMQSKTMAGHDHFGSITHPVETAEAVQNFILAQG